MQDIRNSFSPERETKEKGWKSIHVCEMRVVRFLGNEKEPQPKTNNAYDSFNNLKNMRLTNNLRKEALNVRRL
jgi:hypothetical protein